MARANRSLVRDETRPAPLRRGEVMWAAPHAGGEICRALWFNRDAGWCPLAVWRWRRTVARADAAGCRVYNGKIFARDEHLWTNAGEFERLAAADGSELAHRVPRPLK
jgi:hypothetical protein